MPEPETKVETLLTDLQDLAPAGYAIALHIGFNTPRFLFQTYPVEWLATYSERGMVMNDPTVHWGFENSGHVRWNELAHLDHAGVFDEAVKHGLNHGVTLSIETNGSRTIASFARRDSDFEAAECDTILAKTQELHDLTEDLGNLSERSADRLRKLSIRVTHSVDK